MRHGFSALLGAVAVALWLSPVAVFPLAAADTTSPQLIDYLLPNGLQVVLVPDHRVPKVALTVTYKVGGLNEPPGRSGFAHLFEHLMFSGTPAWPNIDVAFSGLGVTNNAFTQEDQTIYYDEGLSSTLPVLLSIEADRMANLGNAVTQQELDAQRKVVLNEMSQNVLDSPGAAAMQALQAGLYPPGHPYSHAVIGSIPDVQAARLDDVKAFFDIFYVPNNAVLVIVGDFDPDTVKAEITDTLGRVPRGAPVAAPQTVAFTPQHLQLDMLDRVASPYVVLAFSGPDAASHDNSALWILTELLSNSEYGYMRTHMVDTGVATYAYGAWSPAKLGGRFLVGAGAAPDVSAEDLQAALRKAVTDFLATPLDPVDVERARANLLLQDRVGFEPLRNRATGIGMQATESGDLSDALTDDRDVLAATVADVEAVARRVLALGDASVVTVRPGTGGDYPAVLKNSSGVATPLVAVDRPAVEIPKLAAGVPGVATLPAPQTATLSNGITVVHYQLPGAPMTYLAASVSGGTLNDPPGKEGQIYLAASMASRGAGPRDLDAFSKAAKDIGADISSLPAEERSAVLLAVPPDHFAAGVALLADAVQRPRFDQPAWDVLLRQNVQQLKQRQNDVESIAFKALQDQIFHPRPGERATNATVESLQGVNLADARAVYGQLFVPATMTFYSVGALPLSEMLPAIEQKFGSWAAPGAGLPTKPMVVPQFPAARKVIVVPGPPTAQSQIFIARAAPGFNNSTQPAAMAVTRLLGGDFLSRLNTVIRQQKGYSYGVNASMWQALRDGSAMNVSAAVASDSTGPALADMLTGFDSLATAPVTPDELNRSVTAYLTALASNSETAENIINELASGSGLGMTLDEIQSAATAVTRLQLNDVQKVAESLSSLDRAVVVVAGDPAKILPQLAAIGITDAVTLPPPQ